LPRTRHQRCYVLQWKKKYASLGLSELREPRQSREENGKLKRFVADLSLDPHRRSCKKAVGLASRTRSGF
jgi:hypothetical protein